jgi:hypothetical protein
MGAALLHLAAQLHRRPKRRWPEDGLNIDQAGQPAATENAHSQKFSSSEAFASTVRWLNAK